MFDEQMPLGDASGHIPFFEELNRDTSHADFRGTTSVAAHNDLWR